jgi:Tol biopolymer transport system component
MPRLSPDGRHVSFIRKIGAHMEVCTIGTEGKDLHRITYTTGDSTSSMTGSFSPDGRRLLYSTYPGPPAWQTWVADLDGSHKRLVTHNGEQAEWADNGWLVYFTIASTGLRQVTVRSPGIPGKATVLTHNAYNSEHLRIRH